MKVIKPIIFSVFFSAAIFFPTQVTSQQVRYNYAGNELVYVHLDKSTYVAGESLKYKTYLVNALNPGSALCSKILYFTLSGGNEVINWRINITGKSMAGSFPLPDRLKEGMYQLTAYTNWMLNDDPSTFFKQKILITSLSKETGNQIRVLDNTNRDVEGEDQESVLQAVTDRKEYSINQPVNLEISMPTAGKIADLSVSVNADNPFTEILDHKDITDAIPLQKGNLRQKNVINCFYPVEDKGFILSGRIISLQPLSEPCNVWLSVVDSIKPALQYSLTDSLGNFRFYLSSQFDNKELIIQLADPEKNRDCRMELFPKAYIADTATNTMFLDSIHESYLKTCEDIRLIEAVYENEETPGKPGTTTRKLSFLRKPDKVIIPSEFSDMRNFKEIANNIAPDIRFLSRSGKFNLLVLNIVNSWDECNLVLLNGVPFTDMAYVSTLGTKDIKRIEIIKSKVLVGDITLPGLVSIYTYKTEIPEHYLKSFAVRFMNSVMDATSQPQETKAESMQGNHFPQIRNCVYWNPFIKTEGNKPVSVIFPALMLQGHFKVQVEGITEDGIPVHASASFEVKE
ncbi:MAG TPA: hypothetical protein VK179_18625 [Bacteroidales bacterium]|nr:hypothetical protein [Bacteroidales bacterium]